MTTTDIFTVSGTWTCPVGVTTAWVRLYRGWRGGDAVTVRPPASVAFAEYEIMIQRLDWGTF